MQPETMQPETYTLAPIAHIRSDFSDKFGIPRQSGLVQALRADIVFAPPYRNPDALRGLEGYSRLWLIWQFSEVAKAHGDGENWRPTVRPPRLGGNVRMGVFATRSPYRPNALGLSCVELVEIVRGTPDGDVLRVAGADLLDGTPIYDIKPYLPYVDAYPDARGGFSDATANYRLKVDIPETILQQIPPDKREALTGVLQSDPRPAYQHDPSRVYGLDFAGMRLHFTVADTLLTVTDISNKI